MELYPQSWRSDWQQWRQAWTALGDNPLQHYLRISNERRTLQLPQWRRRLNAGLVVIGGAGICWYLTDSLLGSNQDPDRWLLLFVFCSTLFLLVWLTAGLFEAARDGLSVLSQSGKRAVRLQMDEMLALSSLSPAEILLPTVLRQLRLFAPRIASGAVLVVVNLLLVMRLSAASNTDLQVLTAILWSPLTVLCLFGCGMLAVTAVSLGLIAAGRGLVAERLQVLTAISLLIVNLCWGLLASFLVSQNSELNFSSTPYASAALLSLGAGLGALLLHGAFRLAARRVWARVILAVIGPGLLPLTLIVAISSWSALMFYLSLLEIQPDWYWGDTAAASFGQLTLGFVRSWGALALINPLVPPHVNCWGGDAGYAYSTGSDGYVSPLWINLPLTVLLQLGLIAMLGHHCLRAVDLRRQGAD